MSRALTLTLTLVLALVLAACDDPNNERDRANSQQNNDVASPDALLVPISIGGAHACAIRDAGKVYCWGDNGQGQLGDGTTDPSLIPVEVIGIDDAVQVVAGDAHTCALQKSGAVSCWGRNDTGQLGVAPPPDPAAARQLTPVTTLEADADVIQLSGRGSTTCALRGDGGISCWGRAEQSRYTPVELAFVADDVNAIAVSDFKLCTLHAGGDIWCRDEPAANPTLIDYPGVAKAIAVGATNICVITADDTMACWPLFVAEASITPKAISGLTNVTSITDSCALDSSGTLACFAPREIFGDAPITLEPVLGLGEVGWHASGGDTWCAMETGGTVSCWGYNEGGALGVPNLDDRTAPTPVFDFNDTAEVTLGARHACILDKDGAVSCWGSNQDGQLGRSAGFGGSSPELLPPLQVEGLEDITQVAAGDAHTCALHQSGAVSCWGRHQGIAPEQTTGDPPLPPSDFAPRAIEDLSDALSIAAGGDKSCAIHADGGVSCWRFHRLLTGTNPRPAPRRRRPARDRPQRRLRRPHRRQPVVLGREFSARYRGDQ